MKVAITGGIGSGKSYVCNQLRKYGIKVYDCDAAAKKLMRTSIELQNRLFQLIKQPIFINKTIQKSVIAKFLLESESNKQAINNIVHPAVAADFMQSGADWLESAILFESDLINRVPIEKVVCVTAPEHIRVARIVQRDNISPEKALEWIHRQLPQEEILRHSDYEIVNDGKRNLDTQIKQIIDEII